MLNDDVTDLSLIKNQIAISSSFLNEINAMSIFVKFDSIVLVLFLNILSTFTNNVFPCTAAPSNVQSG